MNNSKINEALIKAQQEISNMSPKEFSKECERLKEQDPHLHFFLSKVKFHKD